MTTKVKIIVAASVVVAVAASAAVYTKYFNKKGTVEEIPNPVKEEKTEAAEEK